MDKQIITFSANEQNLVRIGGECHYSSNKVSYIEAHFDLGQNWSGYDSVRAVWRHSVSGKCISTVLDGNDKCIVPTEVLDRTGKVYVNLVGSIAVNDTLTDRLTTYPRLALEVDANALVCGTETAEVTPSQFEQYVSIVHDEVESAGIPTGGATGQVLAKKSATDRDVEWVNQSGGGGTGDYEDLDNKPQVNSVTLSGNKSLTDLGIATKTSQLVNDAGFITDAGVTSFNGQTGAVTYSAPVSSVNGKTGTVNLAASDVGAISAPQSPTTGAFLVWNGSAWVAQTLSTWQGGNY